MFKYSFIKSQRQTWRTFNDAIQIAIENFTKNNHDAQSNDIFNIIENANIDDNSSLNVLKRLCLKFCIALLNHQINKHEYESSLICTLIVLKIHKNQWMNSNKYSFILFAIIKINRMMMMQQTWKKCDHNNFNDDNFVNDNENNNNNRTNEKSSKIFQKMKNKMNRFMIRNNHDFMQWMLNLRTYELKIHYNIIIENHVNWIENEILYKQIQFSMFDFRAIIHELMKRIERLLYDDLLFQKKETKLKLKSLSRISWSRLRNNLVE